MRGAIRTVAGQSRSGAATGRYARAAGLWSANQSDSGPVRRPPSSTKVCQKCKARKPRTEFLVVVGDTGDPEVSLFCEACRSTLQTCVMCGIDKPVCEFNRQSNRRGICKACRRNPLGLMAALQNVQRAGLPYEARLRVNEAIHSSHDRDPDEGLKRTKRRRAERLRAAPRERVDRQAIFHRDGWIYGICGELVAPADATLDHIVPVARGGPHTAANLRIAHAICNSRRQAGTPSPDG